MRLNNSSSQVYMALQAGRDDRREPAATCCSARPRPLFRTELLLSRDITSRTYSFYYPRTRPGSDRCADRGQHQRQLPTIGPTCREEDYAGQQARPDRDDARRPGEVRARHPRQARPCRGRHAADVRALHAAPRRGQLRHEVRGPGRQPGLPEQIAGLYHAGSVGIIMSGWLGAVNYGVIVANDVDALADEADGRDVTEHSRPMASRIMSLRTKSTPPFRTAPPFLLVDEIVEQDDERIVCRKTFRRGRMVLRRPLSRTFRWCRACCCARRPCRPGRSCCRGTPAAATGGVPVATRMNDVRFKRMVRPGETIDDGSRA